jgi:hypothetical protein
VVFTMLFMKKLIGISFSIVWILAISIPLVVSIWNKFFFNCNYGGHKPAWTYIQPSLKYKVKLQV